MKKVRIYIAAHKPFNFNYYDFYEPIHVGAEGKKSLGFLKDNTKDNISSKNSSYCELTGLYWIWKNSKYDIVGLVHYRRFFYNSVFCKKNDILDEQQIQGILKKYDIIVAKRGYTWFSSVKKQYLKKHIKEDLDKCYNVLKTKYPQYVKSFDKIFDGNNYCPLNMMITNKKIFDEYCEWLFDIMFELEKDVNLNDGRDDYNKRVFGFLSERLFNVWLDYNKQYNYIEKPVFNNESNFIIQKIQYIIKVVLRK